MTEIKGDDYYYSAQQLGIDRRIKDLLIKRCMPFVRGPRFLDLGYVDGSWTDRLLEVGGTVTIVEGAARNVEVARARYIGRTDVKIEHVLFDEFETNDRFTTIVAGDMLRYVQKPVVFLRKLHNWLEPGGHLVVTVPNSRSLHRRIGSLMGLERHPMDANAGDVEVGNLRNYDRYQLRSELRDAGFAHIELRGCFLKPLSSRQIADWSDKLLRAFLDVGDELEDYAWFLYAIGAK